MNSGYSIEHSDGVTTIRLSRNLELDDIFEVIDEVAAKDQCNRRLWDLTAGFDFTNQQIEEIANRGKLRWPNASRVAYVASNDLAFGLLRMFEVFREQDHYKTGVFRDEQEALRWLKTE